MFGLSTTEVLVILVVALIVLGPQQLPKVAAQLGKGVRDLQRAANDFKREVTSAAEAEMKKAERPPAPAAPAVSEPEAVADASHEHEGYPPEAADGPIDEPPRAPAAPARPAAPTPSADVATTAQSGSPSAPPAALPQLRPAPSAEPYGSLAALAAANARPPEAPPTPPEDVRI